MSMLRMASATCGAVVDIHTSSSLRPETWASGSGLFVSKSSLRHSGIVFCDVRHTSAQTTKLKEGHSRSRITIMTSPSLSFGVAVWLTISAGFVKYMKAFSCQSFDGSILQSCNTHLHRSKIHGPSWEAFGNT